MNQKWQVIKHCQNFKSLLCWNGQNLKQEEVLCLHGLYGEWLELTHHGMIFLFFFRFQYQSTKMHKYNRGEKNISIFLSLLLLKSQQVLCSSPRPFLPGGTPGDQFRLAQIGCVPNQLLMSGHIHQLCGVLWWTTLAQWLHILSFYKCWWLSPVYVYCLPSLFHLPGFCIRLIVATASRLSLGVDVVLSGITPGPLWVGFPWANFWPSMHQPVYPFMPFCGLSSVCLSPVALVHMI